MSTATLPTNAPMLNAMPVNPCWPRSPATVLNLPMIDSRTSLDPNSRSPSIACRPCVSTNSSNCLRSRAAAGVAGFGSMRQVLQRPWRGCPRDARSVPRSRSPRASLPNAAPAGQTSATIPAFLPHVGRSSLPSASPSDAPADARIPQPNPPAHRRSCIAPCSAAAEAPTLPAG